MSIELFLSRDNLHTLKAVNDAEKFFNRGLITRSKKAKISPEEFAISEINRVQEYIEEKKLAGLISITQPRTPLANMLRKEVAEKAYKIRIERSTEPKGKNK